MSEKQSARFVEQTGRNIDLAFQLFDEVVANETLLDQIPDEGTIILLPYDDPALALKNLAMAFRVAGGGNVVYLRPIGVPPAPNLSFTTQQDILRWSAPSDFAGQMSIEYDPITRAQVFDFSGGQRSTVKLPISTGLALLVDLDAREAVGYRVLETLTEHLSTHQHDATQEGYANDGVRPLNTATGIATFIEDLVPAAA